MTSLLAKTTLWASLSLSLFLGFFSLAQAIDVPPLTSEVVDLAGVFSPNQRYQLEQSLRLFHKEMGPQLQVLTVPSLEGEAIEAFSIRVVDSWKIGEKKRDDGVLVLVVPQDHQARIEVGRGLEGVLPDILAGRIIRDKMTPYFKQNQYPEGIIAGLNAVAAQLGGSLKEGGQPGGRPLQTAAPSDEIPLAWVVLFIIFFLFLFLGSGRPNSFRSFLLGLIFGRIFNSRNDRWRDPGDFGGGDRDDDSGDFRGGGGGGFSGGGASGNW